MKPALITGITGQDGSYLAELLLAKGYEVHGLDPAFLDLQHRAHRAHVRGSAGDGAAADPALRRPDGLVAAGDVAAGRFGPTRSITWRRSGMCGCRSTSRSSPGNTTGLGTARMLEAIRMVGIDTRFYQASSSEMFGATPPPQSEETPFYPRVPYGAAKVYGYWMARNYREAHGMFAVNGILFNHESPRRGETFVTRKIARAAARIAQGKEEFVTWATWTRSGTGGTPRSTWRACGGCCRPTGDDYVLATGTATTVREWVEYCFDHVDLDWESHVRFDETICGRPRWTR